ncbi:MAG: type VI secretion system ATPase TssH [Nibricoccus sp.]
MSEIKRSTLFGKLNPVAFKLIESATVLCKKRGNPYVEFAHWVAEMLTAADTDFFIVAGYFGCDFGRLNEDLAQALDCLPRGATAIADFSPHLDEAVEHGWTYASLVFGELQIRTGHVLLGVLKTPSLKNVLLGLSVEFGRIKADVLAEEFAKILQRSKENGLASSQSGAAPGVASQAVPSGNAKQEALKRFTTDITDKARKGELDPIIGRDEEIRLCLDILMRRRQNNPILAGEAGVGKTAVVEGLALRVVAGDVPPSLKDVRICGLDVGLLQAGASMKGEFEQRLRSVIDEVQASPQPIILFIDEAHTLIGAGGSAGTGDAANLLKPALARGSLRTIAATTWQEYKRHIEKDPALTRRFQIVKVEEPSEEKCVQMMRNVALNFEKHHKVRILDEAIEAAVRFSHRYITARQLPDKAVGLIDTACARVALSQQAVPAALDSAKRRIELLNTELAFLKREAGEARENSERRGKLEFQLKEAKQELEKIESRWRQEKTLVDRLLTVQNAGSLTTAAPAAAVIAPAKRGKATKAQKKSAGSQGDILSLRAELQKLQGESPMIWPQVDQFAIADVVADWTGIPVGRMVKNEVERVLRLTETLEQRVLGQRSALETIVRRIQSSRAKLDNPNRPVGVFMLVGPSGTGKTETALALAEALFGGEQKLITINMSEFQEAHTVSTLKGSPPGYVGYGEGGVLTEAVRRQPYSVVLLDEVEKAHTDVHEIFFQVFDKGFMEDAEGRFIDFKNTLILLTSNTAQDVIVNLCKDPELVPTQAAIESALRQPLMKVFPDALLNRLVVVPYAPISQSTLHKIIELNLVRVGKRIQENHGIPLTYDKNVLTLIGKRCGELERGARIVEGLITQEILPEIAREVLSRISTGTPLKKVQLSANENEFTFSYK